MEVFRSIDHDPSNMWTTWENIARPWFLAEYSQPFDRMIILVTSIPHGGSYEREYPTVRQPDLFQWFEDLPTGTYSWFARFEFWDGPTPRWSDFFQGPDFFVDRNGPNYLSVSSNGYPVSYFTPLFWTNRSDLTFTWANPGDPGSGVHHYEVSVDNGNFQVVNSGYSPALTTGEHSYSFRAVDNLGLAGSGDQLKIKVDLDPPTISPYEGYGHASGNADPAWTRYPEMRFILNAYDIGSGIESSYISVDEAGFGYSTFFSETYVTVGNGFHTFDFKSEDRAGNVSTIKRLYARVDTELPYVEILSPSTNTLFNSDTLEVLWTGDDQVSGLNSFSWSLDNAAMQNVGSSNALVLKDLAEGAHQLIIIVSDLAGNTFADTLNFLADHSAPVISSNHPDLQIAGDASCALILQDYTAGVAASDNYSTEVQVVQSPEAGTVLSGNSNEITLSVTDEAGNSSNVTFNIEVTDVTEPAISFSENKEIVLDADCSFVLPDYTVDDALTVVECAEYALAQDPPAGTTISDTTMVTITATDASGNSAAAYFSVNTADDTDPVIACVASQEVTLEPGETQYTVPGAAFDPSSFSDNCGEVVLTNDLNQSATLEGAVLDEGTTTITWTATDGYGNSASCSCTVTVSSNVGTELQTAPKLSVYPNPTSGKVILVSEVEITGILITDASGKTIRRFTHAGRTCEVDLSSQDSGLYIFRLLTRKGTINRMVMLR